MNPDTTVVAQLLFVNLMAVATLAVDLGGRGLWLVVGAFAGLGYLTSVFLYLCWQFKISPYDRYLQSGDA